MPGRIFISIPTSSDVRNLRVAEAIVHEAMHLNLTNLERVTELVRYNQPQISPWRAELRPAAGLLHGIYVFSCVSLFYWHLENNISLEKHQKNYAKHSSSDPVKQFLGARPGWSDDDFR